MTTPEAAPMLAIRDLRVSFPTDDGVVHAVNGMDLTLARGETVGIVGESGSGKTVTSQALMGLLKDTTAAVTGQILLDGQDLNTLTETQMRAYRGKKIAMIFQDPLSAMHPFYPVGAQIAEAYRVHNNVSKKAAHRSPSTCSAASGSPTRNAATRPTRTSSPAVCGSAR